MLYDKKNCVQNIYFWIWPAFVERIRKGKITMINIAICDSDESGAFRIEEMIYNLAGERNIGVDCSVFFDGMALVKHICQGAYYDLIYLDDGAKQPDGIHIAKLIKHRDIPALIIIFSTYEVKQDVIHHAEPFRLLVKPIDIVAFRSAFWAAYKRIAQRPEYFSYTFHKICFKLPLDKIIYFSSCNRVITIHVAENIQPEPAEYNDEETKFYGKMNDLEKQLAERGARFIRIHQSFLVNFDYIKSMGSKEVIMLDGTLLQISEDRHKLVRARFRMMTGAEIQPGKNRGQTRSAPLV